jgi:hypothetical protein
MKLMENRLLTNNGKIVLGFIGMIAKKNPHIKNYKLASHKNL